MHFEITKVDYRNPAHARDLIYLLDLYATSDAGGGTPLSEYAREHLAEKLAATLHALSLIAYADGKPAALANCFEGFSTFQCRPLINIHDFVVAPEFRGCGLSQLLLAHIEKIAREQDCVKLTLEVLEGNAPAIAAYRKFGFAGYQLDPQMGHALFFEKSLS